MHIHSTRGVSVTHKMGYLGNYPSPVWYLTNGHANILSLHDITWHYRVTMDTAVENLIILHSADGQQHRFTPSGKGLYKWEHRMDPTTDIPCWLFITTVRGQGDHYTWHDYKHAQAARRLQNIIMHPARCHMSDVAVSHLRNCLITKEDVWAADDISGLDLGSLKGKTVWHPNKHVQAGTSAVPRSILKLHQDVVLSLNIMLVNKLLFLLTSSHNIFFSTVESLPNCQVGTVAACLKKVIQLYHHCGFHITSITCDPEFEALRPSFPMLNCCTAGKHVPEIERYIHTLKDRTQSAYNILPFKNLPWLILIHLLKNCTLWLNAFPAANGVSSVHSPHFLLTGRELSFDKHTVLEFGSYVQTHEEHSNGMEPRTMGAICLGPTGNAQGGHYVVSSVTTGLPCPCLKKLFSASVKLAVHRGCHPVSHMQTGQAMRYPIVSRIFLMTMMPRHPRVMTTPTWRTPHTLILTMMTHPSLMMRPHPLTMMTMMIRTATLTFRPTRCKTPRFQKATMMICMATLSFCPTRCTTLRSQIPPVPYPLWTPMTRKTKATTMQTDQPTPTSPSSMASRDHWQ